MTASRTSGSPNFARTLEERPHEIGSPTPRLCRSLARSLTPPSPSRAGWPSFTNVKETKMTYELEIQIEELRAFILTLCTNSTDLGSSMRMLREGAFQAGRSAPK